MLEMPSPRRRDEFIEAVLRSAALHAQWVDPPRTPGAFNRYLDRLRQPQYAGYFLLARNKELAGVVNISEIVEGSFRSGYLGYYAFVPHERQGYMAAGLPAVLSRAFRRLRLHRLEANIQPGNEASRRLVKRLGFRCEGYSPRYLKIAGQWRDHERWALMVEEWRAGRSRVPMGDCSGVSIGDCSEG